MLPDGNAGQAVLLGETGVWSSLTASSLVLDASSSQPWLTRETSDRLAERGITMVDAAV